jgi:phenylpyruvate tautomerase PptA (4-oxalocrotonate tautomerase family)
MPIVDVEVVLGAGETLTANMASMLADAIGEVFGTPRGRTWVRLRHLNRADYAEQGGITDDIRPVFITVLKSQRPENETMRHGLPLWRMKSRAS